MEASQLIRGGTVNDEALERSVDDASRSIAPRGNVISSRSILAPFAFAAGCKHRCASAATPA
jgi:hypothetical protein